MTRVVLGRQNMGVPDDPRVWNEATSLAEAGHQVIVVAPRTAGSAGDERLDGVTIVRYWCPRDRTAASLEAAVNLATPPLAVAVMLVAVAAVLAAVAGAWVPLAVLVGLLASVAFGVVVALVVARAGVRAWAALLLAPAYVVWKFIVQLRAIGASRTADRPFEPTMRN